MKCGKITITNGKAKECNHSALWESPKRLRTDGRLKVCGLHRSVMEKEYRQEGKSYNFIKLEQTA